MAGELIGQRDMNHVFPYIALPQLPICMIFSAYGSGDKICEPGNLCPHCISAAGDIRDYRSQARKRLRCVEINEASLFAIFVVHASAACALGWMKCRQTSSMT